MRESFTLPPAIERILEAARWAPSGDNAQPWTFTVDGGTGVAIDVRCSATNVYEYRAGEPTLLAAGTLLENIAVAAPVFGKCASWKYLGETGGVHRIAVHFEDTPVRQHPLFSFIWQRSVDRRPYRMRSLSARDKTLLTQAVDADIAVEWHESFAARWKIAALALLSTDIRLRIPEAFDIHRNMVDWTRLLSPDGLPSRAIGLEPLTLMIMRWAMADWRRASFGNRMGSTLFAGLQMDILPGLFSAGYFALRMAPAAGVERIVQLLRAGQSVQRLWLTATRLGLAMQPAQAVLAFTHYGATGAGFTTQARERRAAIRLAERAEAVLSRPQELVFLARVGTPWPRKRESRSVRRPLADLLRSSPA